MCGQGRNAYNVVSCDLMSCVGWQVVWLYKAMALGAGIVVVWAICAVLL